MIKYPCLDVKVKKETCNRQRDRYLHISYIDTPKRQLLRLINKWLFVGTKEKYTNSYKKRICSKYKTETLYDVCISKVKRVIDCNHGGI